MSVAQSASHVDGRSARRARNRDAVIDAFIELIMSGENDPSVDEIADKAGVSYRSVYRYFEDRSDMLAAANERSMQWIRPLLVNASGPVETDAPLDHRIDAVVDARAEVYAQISDILHTALMRAHEDPYIDNELRKARDLLREQIDVRFDQELSQFSARERALRLTSIDQTLHFQSLDYVMRERGHNRDELERYLRTQVRAALTIPEPD